MRLAVTAGMYLVACLCLFSTSETGHTTSSDGTGTCSMSVTIDRVDRQATQALLAAGISCTIPAGTADWFVALPFAVPPQSRLFQEPTDAPTEFFYGTLSGSSQFGSIMFPAKASEYSAKLVMTDVPVKLSDTGQAASGSRSACRSKRHRIF
jgi:hypothetical protein